MHPSFALAAQAVDDSGFSLGTLALYVGGAALLAFFCSIGLIARIRENKLQQRAAARREPDEPTE